MLAELWHEVSLFGQESDVSPTGLQVDLYCVPFSHGFAVG